MGYLTIQGKLLTFSEYKDYCEQYKINGLREFIELYKVHKNVHKEIKDLKWGEEMEYNLFFCDTREEALYLTNQGFHLIDEFNMGHQDEELHLQPEFGNWMIEAVPARPYNSILDVKELLSSFEKLTKRRQILSQYFTMCGLVLTSTATPPILGTKNHMWLNNDPELEQEVQNFEGQLEKRNKYSESRFVIDSTENPHPRFPGLMKSIRERRGDKIKILIPIYQDKNTNLTEPTYEEPYPGSIYMDAMHFGMGCSCLQVTFETQTFNHARYLHDMLLPFTPLLSALSASAPIYKGKLSNIDMRWTVISQSVDCRTKEEMDPSNDKYIPKSRYSTMNHYISKHEYVKDAYFDTPQYKVNPKHMELLQEGAGLDERIAFHVASLFVRDPIPTYDNELSDDIDPKSTTAHFENLQSTNWNSMRFKPPPSFDSKIGWRVEFRPMDIQLTDFENAGLIVLLGMLVNISNHYDVDFIMPISKIDENMERAHHPDALYKEKFWFKLNVLPNADSFKQNVLESTDYLLSNKSQASSTSEDKFEELYLYEILEGRPDLGYKGLYPLIEEFMFERNYAKEDVSQVRTYFSFILARAKGEIKSGARFIREFVLNHPEYQQDSFVSNKIAYDLVSKIIDINTNSEEQAKFLGKKWA